MQFPTDWTPIYFDGIPDKRDKLKFAQVVPFAFTKEITNLSTKYEQGKYWVLYSLSADFHTKLCKMDNFFMVLKKKITI